MILRRAPGGGPAPYFFERARARRNCANCCITAALRCHSPCSAYRKTRYTGPASGYWTSPRCHPKYAHRRPASGAPTASRRHRWCSARRWWSNRPPHARGHRCVRADAAVVTHHDLVVQLDAVGEGVFERAAIDRGVGADLDVVADGHAAQLGILPQAPCPARDPARNRNRPRPARHRYGGWRGRLPDAFVQGSRARAAGCPAPPRNRRRSRSGPSTAPRPMRAPDSTTQSGPMRAPSSMTASAATTAEGCVPPGSAGRRAASNHWATRAYSR